MRSTSRSSLALALLAAGLCCRPAGQEMAGGEGLTLGKRRDQVVQDGALPRRMRRPDREAAVEAWRKAPGGETVRGLARTFFPELFVEDAGDGDDGGEPVDPGVQLRVRLPEEAGGVLELATRGHVFKVRQVGQAPAPDRHLLQRVGGRARAGGREWHTPRVEEYVVMEGGGRYQARYEVTLPEGVTWLRDAEDYLELSDRRQVPVLRLHYPVARDAGGRSRQGQARAWGATVEPLCGKRSLLSVAGRTLLLELSVAFEDWEGPVVVDPGWSSTGAMAAAREGHGATLLPDGKVLVAGGIGPAGYLASAELYDPGTGTWSAVDSLASPRFVHTATLLPDGKVLVAGGGNASGSLASAELYDPATSTWTIAGSMASRRRLHTATLLPDGKVLVVGGYFGGALDGAEVYDPGLRTWAATGPLGVARFNHTATLLPDGKVLVTGGSGSSGAVAVSEEYDPATGAWTPRGSLASARSNHTATLLPDGRLLAAGGSGDLGTLASSELYDQATGAWTPTGDMAADRLLHSATLLPGGKVVVAGGEGSGGYLASTEVYDPGTGTWAAAGPLAAAREYHSATLMPDGRLLVAGGFNSPSGSLASAEVFDAQAGGWTAAAPLATARWFHTSTLLPDGRVLVTGGYNGSHLASAELHDPATGSWTATGSLLTARSRHTATLLPEGKVLVAGGDDGAALSSSELYDPATGGWTATAGSLATARKGHTATLLASGKVLVAGGEDGGALASAEVYDPVPGGWFPANPLATARVGHAATRLLDGTVLVTGGLGTAGIALVSTEVYIPATGAWVAPLGMSTARQLHTATLLADGRVLVAGGINSGGRLGSAEVYDPGTGACGPGTGTWAGTGGLLTPRSGATATLLPGGRVLVAGGTGSTGALAGAEVYSAGTGAWTATGSMAAAREGHSATPLADGRVLVAGGNGGAPLASAELYDDTGAAAPWRPVVSPLGPLQPLSVVTATGSRFRGFSEASGGSFQSSATNFPLVTLTAVEGGAVVTLPGRGHQATSVTVDIPALPNGHYVLGVSASAVRGGRVVKLADTTAPAAPVVATPADGSTTSNVFPRISGTAEADSTVTVFVDGAPAGMVRAATGSFAFTPPLGLSSDVHTVFARATDLAGNTSPSSNTNRFTVDNVAPAAPVFTGPIGTTSTTTPAISGISEPLGTVTLRVDGSPPAVIAASASGTWSYTSPPLSQGPHDVLATAADAAGNTSLVSSRLTFTVDSVAPGAPVIATPAALVATPDPAISGTAEPGSTVVLRLDGGTPASVPVSASGDWSYTPPTLSQGAHTVLATATDAAGNISPVSPPRTFIVDSVAPAVPAFTSPAVLVNTTEVAIGGTAEADSAVALSLDGQVVTLSASLAGVWSYTSPTLAQGPHSVTATATDAAGNTSPASAPRTFTVDSIAPGAPSITTPSARAMPARELVSLEGTAEPGSTLRLVLDRSPLAEAPVADASGAWSVPLSAALATGEHHLLVTATDAAGNTSQPAQVYFTVEQPGGCGCSATSAAQVPLWLGLLVALSRRRRWRAR